jgi:hypothetical protein
MTSPEPQQADETPEYVYMVFTSGGGFCMTHIGPEAEFTSASHAAVVQGFSVKLPMHDDFREYKR